ncbi:MAG: toxin-antitoxin system HicB family antitoxin [Candidatus Desantisbacteria bacterium]
MIELKVRLPDKLYRKVCEISKMNTISTDEIIAASLVQKLFRIIPDPYLEERAKRATGKGLLLVLSQVPDVPPDDYDRL